MIRFASTLRPAKTYPPSLYSKLTPISFSIIAHVDHGKSTLADRLLEHTETIPLDPEGKAINKQVLDSLKVERERGITVKSQAVSMVYKEEKSQKTWLLNLIDTPGHVDFSYEVSRSLSACQIALLVVDATQGVQAQTLSVFRVAIERGLRVIPVINKIDLPSASPDSVIEQLVERLGLDAFPGGENEPVLISAKTGKGVEQVLERIVAKGKEIFAQKQADAEQEPLRALVFDSWYDTYKGVVALVSIKNGALCKGDKIASAHSKKRYEVLDVGVNSPTAISTDILAQGQVGWMTCNMKSVPEASVGDTFHHQHVKVTPLEGFKPSVPMVYASAFPIDSNDFIKLDAAIQRLALNDRSIVWSRETSIALGQGFKLGLLGALHLEIFRARLADEYSMQVLITNPNVAYRLWDTEKQESIRMVTNPLDLDEDFIRRKASNKVELQEPLVIGTLTCPDRYIGAVSQLCFDRRGEEVDVAFDDRFGNAIQGTDAAVVTFKYRFPLSEVVTDFFTELKSKTAGFATFEYEEAGWQKSDLVRLTFALSGSPLDALSQIVHRSKAYTVAKYWTEKLRQVVPRQQYEVRIQAMENGKVIASERIQAFRKDVTAGLYGGHYERKQKQLNKQKEGKKKLKALSVGRVSIPQENFLKLFES